MHTDTQHRTGRSLWSRGWVLGVLLGLFGAGSRVRPLTLRVPLVIVESRVSLLPSMQPMRTGRRIPLPWRRHLYPHSK